MASIIPGFEYDIFISYRHNDNRGGWVTDFVAALEEELAATIKESLTIYFDKNPHDGLLESHNVDKSLEGKLKCVIFIPIISQTYCDPKSFAWQHEFCAFNQLANADALGRDVKLSNGNVASRILSVKIHDLDEEDKATIERETGAILRAIEFIYKEPGVNRPLKSTDARNENQNHTDYRNQINKVANAIKEILYAVKYPNARREEPKKVIEEKRPEPTPANAEPSGWARNLREIRKTIFFIIGAAALVYFIFFDKSEKETEASKDFGKSIAVLPFEDMSATKDQEYFSDGIAEEILNSLAHIKELKVAGRTSSFQFKGQHADLKEVGKKLNVETVLEGSVRKAGNRVRITAQLINVQDGYHIWSETYDRDMSDIFAIQDEVAKRIAGVLVKELTASDSKGKSKGTTNAEAYQYYLEGKHINLHRFAQNGNLDDFQRSEKLFKQALALDENYALAHAGLADLYNTYTSRIKRDSMYMRLQTQEIERAYALDPDDDYVNNALSQVQTIKGEYVKAHESMMKAYAINPNDANNCYSLGASFNRFGLLDEAMVLVERAEKIDPLDANNFFLHGSLLFQLGRYDEAYENFQKVLKIQPDNIGAEVFYLYYYILKNKMDDAKKIVDKQRALPPNPFFNSALAMYEAKLGHKDQAIKMSPSFQVYTVLGMREEAIKDLVAQFSRVNPPLNGYLQLTKTNLLNMLGKDPRLTTLLEQQKKGYEENKAKYHLPADLK